MSRKARPQQYLNPEVEGGLVAQAQARGLSLETYLLQVLMERSAVYAAHVAAQPSDRVS